MAYLGHTWWWEVEKERVWAWGSAFIRVKGGGLGLCGFSLVTWNLKCGNLKFRERKSGPNDGPLVKLTKILQRTPPSPQPQFGSGFFGCSMFVWDSHLESGYLFEVDALQSKLESCTCTTKKEKPDHWVLHYKPPLMPRYQSRWWGP